MERESMEFDVVIIGAGVSGLSAACRLMQLSKEKNKELNVCVVEKGSEVGAHILSGAVFEPTALNELFPNWKELGAPLNTSVSADEIYLLRSEKKSIKIPSFFAPKTMHNDGNYVISLGNLCRWMSDQAESLGVEIFPGFASQQLIFNDNGSVKGVITGDMGVSRSGEKKDGFMPGIELHAKYTLFAEGCRGHLGKELISHFELDKNCDPQHYGLGIKELWDIPAEQHQPGLVVHTAGWPLTESNSTGGGFVYHLENNQVALGLITDLNYSNPYVDPFEEFQRFKKNPIINKHIDGGKRISYGARALAKGGLQSLPNMVFPGGLLIGCDAGTLNNAKIKGSHTAMKSGMIAAEEVFKTIYNGSDGGEEIKSFHHEFKSSWLYKELHQQRNFAPAMHKLGNILGAAFAFVDLNIFNGKLPFTLRDKVPDYACLKPAKECSPINYPKPDGTLTFDRTSSVFFSNTNHSEDQPCHLKLEDSMVPLEKNLPIYNEPAERYCPAGVYEVVLDDKTGTNTFQINSQNCIHCKTCDIKDPAQNITWTSPEGAGGPNYPNM